jgi:hypothetical protein
MTIGSRILMFALIISLGACATEISKVERKTVDVEGAYTVDPQITWSEFPGSSTASNGLVWTVDGLFLQRLDLFGGIEDGQALFEPTGAEEESLPVFRAVRPRYAGPTRLRRCRGDQPAAVGYR